MNITSPSTDAMAIRNHNAINGVLVSALILVAVYSLPAITSVSNTNAEAASDNANPRKHPGSGVATVVGLESTTENCDIDQPASSTKGGLYVKFRVPSTITTIENSGQPEDGVNIHVAFKGSSGNYYEAGIIYGDWSPSVPHDEEEFTFYWGRSQAGAISGVSTLDVVAGHDVEIYLWYQSSTSKWIVWFKDVTTGATTTHTIATTTEKVASDYLLNIETNTLGPNDNSEALGEVQFKALQKATKIPNDGVSYSNWVDAFFTNECSGFSDGNYGVDTPSGVGNFRMGYLADHRNNGYQLW
jgi:hypothetical protein